MDEDQETVRIVEVNKKSRIRKLAATIFILFCLVYGYFYLMSTTTSGGSRTQGRTSCARF